MKVELTGTDPGSTSQGHRNGYELFPFSFTYFLCVVLLCISYYHPIGNFLLSQRPKALRFFPHPYQTLDPSVSTPEQLDLHQIWPTFLQEFCFSRALSSLLGFFVHIYQTLYLTQNIIGLFFKFLSFFFYFLIFLKISYPLSFSEWIISLHLCLGNFIPFSEIYNLFRIIR